MSRRALLEAVRAHAQRDPGALAASDGELRLDRGTLARASAAIARTIAAEAVTATSASRAPAAFAASAAPEPVAVTPGAAHPPGQVGLLAGHRAVALVGVLGVLESGRCLVPLSGHESDALLAALARDARIGLLLVDRAHAPRARAIAGEGVPVVELEDVLSGGRASAVDDTAPNDPLGFDGADRRPDAGLPAEDLVSILYTSGTTAAPKGVMTTAASVAARTREYLDASALAAGERQAAITAWHFAASIPEIYGALVAGAELRLYDAHARGVEGLPAWLRSERIDCLQLPVAIARRLLGGDARSGLAGVRFASISGDRLLQTEAEALLEAMAPGGVLLHTYGSTETNLIAQSALRLPSRDWPASAETGVLPVGRPVAGKRVSIVDEAGRAVAPGESGRVAVESPLLSPGYWNQPERTAEAFRIGADGRRVFVSGDFGRLRDDGELELVGRDAAQVKIRGMRVDLAAVEAALLAQPGVANAAVVARAPAALAAPAATGAPAASAASAASAATASEVRLVAYVEAAPDVELDTTTLRQALQGRMPAHAIPTRFVFLAAMPWTASGKLDRRALPDPGRTRPKQSVPYVAPRNADEAALCARWAERFELDEVGVDDGFFDLGGDSLWLVEVLFALEQETGHPVSLAELGGLPTPARLAALVRRARAGAGEEAGTEAEAESGSVAVVSVAAADPARVRRRSALRRLRSAAKHALRNPLRAGGPMLLGRPLAYARGVPVHAALARTLVRAGLYREALRPIATWHARLADGLEAGRDPASPIVFPATTGTASQAAPRAASLERALARSLVANTWVDWRLRALEKPSDFDAFVAIEGVEHLDAVSDLGRGLVLVITHVHWNALLTRLPSLRKRESFLVRQPKGLAFGAGPDAIVTERAEQLQAATRCLARGGLVLIAGDEGHGRAAVERSFFGTTRRFRPGAAALAETARAALVPVFSRLEDGGRIVLRFEAPLDSSAETPEARILDQTARYADLYVAAWPRIYDSVTWKSARRALEPPGHW